MTTGLVWEERLMWHDTGMYFGPADVSPWIEPIQPPENADGKRRIKNLLDRSGSVSYTHLTLPTNREV